MAIITNRLYYLPDGDLSLDRRLCQLLIIVTDKTRIIKEIPAQ
jgi:hypothetical protein